MSPTDRYRSVSREIPSTMKQGSDGVEDGMHHPLKSTVDSVDMEELEGLLYVLLRLTRPAFERLLLVAAFDVFLT
jgi:hypothetical protein